MSFADALAAGEKAAERYALTVPHTLAQGLGGTRLGRRSGSSQEFQEHRDYQPGDDLRHLDWSAYARSDRLVVKLYHEEVDPHLDLLVDGSRSMALPESAKANATAGLAALLAQAAAHTGFTCAAWLAGDGCQRLGIPGGRPITWENIDFEVNNTLGEAFVSLPPGMRARGLRILVSDLLSADEPRALLDRVVQGAAAVVVVQLVARDDLEPPSPGFYQLVDHENGETRDILVDNAAAQRYRAAVTAHQEMWQRACREVGATLVQLVAEELVPGGFSTDDAFPAVAMASLVEREVLDLR